MNEFIQHWSDINTLLAAPLVLSDSRTLVMFINWLGQIETKITEVSADTIAAATRKAELDVLKANMISWTVIFNATVRADHAARVAARTLVNAPAQADGRGAFVAPVAQTEQIWRDLNTDAGADVELRRHLTLPNGTIQTTTLTREDYQTALTALQAKWNDWDRARKKVDTTREERNDFMALAYNTMRDYRLKVPLELPPDHALVASLPLLNPDPALRPDAPEAAGSWNSGTEKADLTATASTSPDVTRHELRWSPGEGDYEADNEVVLATLPVGEALTFSTDIGLAVPGDVSRFTWVAVNASGHEGRSNVVAVVRGS
jgi:hypothetical protein